MRSRSIIWSFNHAIDGLVYAIRTQRNMRIHVATGAAVLAASLFFRVGRAEFLAVLLTVGLVIAAELVNTAVEATVDVATDGYDPVAKVAKDVAAAAVFVTAVVAMVVGYVVFFGRLTDTAHTLIVRVREAPSHVTVVALGLTAFIVLVLKALSGHEGTWMRGGWPSGHVALASGAATAIAFITGSGAAWVIGLFVAGLVAQSRVESEAHTVWQAVWGGIVGIVVTSAVFALLWS
ncbi:MAG: diacylglycerol kinase [Anaerosomatales bacterium]|nr:diacylglycerol kinase [Anaerosomatales bacterium]